MAGVHSGGSDLYLSKPEDQFATRYTAAGCGSLPNTVCFAQL